MATRKEFLKTAGLVGLASMVNPVSMMAVTTTPQREQRSGWADGSRLVVSVSMQFEAGGQPEHPESPFPQNMLKGYKDWPANTWYEYGYKEGIPRMLDNWDKHGIKVTSHMVGSAVEKNPALAREIVQRGHEAAAHGRDWSSQYMLSYEEEKRFIKDGVEAVKKATGVVPVGYNANWLRRGDNTLTILQELGFLYHIDDLSRDEPFITKVNNVDFAVVPYTLRCNDIQLITGQWFSTDQFLQQVKMEFDQLYEEAAHRRRMMSISFHDRIGGSPQMVKATSELFTYMKQHAGVSFKRKDEIAKMALADKHTIRE
ncbi:polysaccharide deacetylase family protein [Chitinophaga polysaccharea]|uniref:polysaccharide deacetylase family protein n=1 Tax=Chitinophaga TaxID=79328 RepID=UPI0014556510|nr:MULTISPECIES: polysaccharide deacetylase family protein [Chitinophaga]NLR61909.1 polysaccharide deacetylase family protein [Chitinophaga polysaccharea]NLU94458.1 polysaccharide deacetylase family protein [Chitinophaga sp. Ak27]